MRDHRGARGARSPSAAKAAPMRAPRGRPRTRRRAARPARGARASPAAATRCCGSGRSWSPEPARAVSSPALSRTARRSATARSTDWMRAAAVRPARPCAASRRSRASATLAALTAKGRVTMVAVNAGSGSHRARPVAGGGGVSDSSEHEPGAQPREAYAAMRWPRPSGSRLRRRDDDAGATSAAAQRGARTSGGDHDRRAIGGPSRRRRLQQRRGATARRRGRGAGRQAGRHLPGRPHRRHREGHRRRPEHRQQARSGAPRGRLGDARGLRPRRTSSCSTALAEEVTAEGDRTAYVIRLREGIEFHNGKTLGADDVIYSLKRLINPKLGLFGGAALASVDPKRHDQGWTSARSAARSSRPTRPSRTRSASTSPASSPTATPDKGSVGRRRPDRHGPVHAGELHAGPARAATPATRTTGAAASRSSTRSSSSTSPTTRAGQRAAGRAGRRHHRRAVRAGAGSWRQRRAEGARVPRAAAGCRSAWRVDQEPFTDVRVRQAFRLIVDRAQMVQQALVGPRPGRPTTSTASFDACYPTDLPAAHAGHRAGEVPAGRGRPGGPDGRPADHERRRPAWSSRPRSSRSRPRRPA